MMETISSVFGVLMGSWLALVVVLCLTVFAVRLVRAACVKAPGRPDAPGKKSLTCYFYSYLMSGKSAPERYSDSSLRRYDI